MPSSFREIPPIIPLIKILFSYEDFPENSFASLVEFPDSFEEEHEDEPLVELGPRREPRTESGFKPTNQTPQEAGY